MANAFPYNLNSFIPEAEASLVTDFSQNPNAFAFNQYSTMVKVDQPSFYKTDIDTDESSRLEYTDPEAGTLWADGADLPRNFSQGEKRTLYNTKRFAFGFTLGWKEVQHADYDKVASWSQSAVTRLMTLRTKRAFYALDNATYPTGHDTAASGGSITGGGKWLNSSSTNIYVQKCLDYAYEKILIASNGTVRREDCIVVMSQSVKNALNQSPEIRDVYKNSPFSGSVVQTGSLELSPDFYGMKWIVEGTVINSAKKGQARNAGFGLGDTVYVIARPGKQLGNLNTMSGLTLAVEQDFNIKIHNDEENERYKGRVSEQNVIIPETRLIVRISDVL